VLAAHTELEPRLGCPTALGAEAQRTSRRYDIDAYVRKMERLYDLMARVSKPTKRQGLLHEDLSFLDDGVKA